MQLCCKQIYNDWRKSFHCISKGRRAICVIYLAFGSCILCIVLEVCVCVCVRETGSEREKACWCIYIVMESMDYMVLLQTGHRRWNAVVRRNSWHVYYNIFNESSNAYVFRSANTHPYAQAATTNQVSSECYTNSFVYTHYNIILRYQLWIRICLIICKLKV